MISSRFSTYPNSNSYGALRYRPLTFLNRDSPLHIPNSDRPSTSQTAIAPHIPNSDRTSPPPKQRSHPHIPQTAIALHHPQQRSPSHILKKRSPLTSPKQRSHFPHPKTAITPHIHKTAITPHIHKKRSPSHTPKSDRPLTSPNNDRPIKILLITAIALHHPKTAIAPSHPQQAIAIKWSLQFNNYSSYIIVTDSPLTSFDNSSSVLTSI